MDGRTDKVTARASVARRWFARGRHRRDVLESGARGGTKRTLPPTFKPSRKVRQVFDGRQRAGDGPQQGPTRKYTSGSLSEARKEVGFVDAFGALYSEPVIARAEPRADGGLSTAGRRSVTKCGPWRPFQRETQSPARLWR